MAYRWIFGSFHVLQAFKLEANKLNCCLPSAAHFKLLKKKKKKEQAIDVDCLDLVDDKITRDVWVIIIIINPAPATSTIT